MNRAEFTINGVDSSIKRGFDATPGQVLSLALLASPPSVSSCQFDIVPVVGSSKGASAVTFSSGGIANPVGSVVTMTIPTTVQGLPSWPSDVPHSYMVRCTVSYSGTRGVTVSETFSRIVAVNVGAGRKVLPGETIEYEPESWAAAINDVIEEAASLGVQGISALGSVASSAALDGSAANIVSLTATGNITLTLTNLVVGKDYSIDFTQDATGGRTLTLAGFTPLVAGSFDVDPTADATTVLTFRVIRAGKVMLSAPPATLIQTNLIRSAQATDLTLMPGDYDSSGIGTRCVSFNVKSANASGKSGSWITKCRDFGIVVDGWQYFATPGNPDTNPSVVQSCKDVFVIQRLGATCGYWEVESLGAGDFYYSLTGSGSSFNVRGGAGNFFTVTSAGAVTLSPKAADLRLTADSTYKVKIDEAGTEVCWFSDESGVSTIEGQSTTCFKAVTGANVRIQGNAVEIWDNVGPTKLATVDSAGGATTITEHQGIWINLGAIIIERPSTYRGFETPLVYHDLANGGARAFQSDSNGFAIGGATSVGQGGALKIPVLAGDPSGNPPAGFIYIYGKGTGVYSKNSSGTVVAL